MFWLCDDGFDTWVDYSDEEPEWAIECISCATSEDEAWEEIGRMEYILEEAA